jgi:hypothetical protein
MSAWVASLTMKPTQRSGQLIQRATRHAKDSEIAWQSRQLLST